MNILVIGGGGREHALAWKIAQSKRLTALYVAPGNPGTADIATNVDIAADDCVGLVDFAVANNVDLVVVGPEQPLVAGISDMLAAKGIATFGPSKAAVELESSKAFSKDLMQKLGIPTAAYQTFTGYDAAKAYVHKQGAPIVVKASGLAAGKGAIVCQTLQEADDALHALFIDKLFGAAGTEVVVEECMVGPELSIHVLSDGANHIVLPPSQDHKQIGDGNTGDNTGGMGTIAPLPGVSHQLMDRIDAEIVTPILDSMRAAGTPYVGLLYPGIMLTDDGPKVLEFNCRFGDPETQSYMRLLTSDIVDVFEACTNGTLNKQKLEWQSGAATNIVLAAEGYPGPYDKGTSISGIEKAQEHSGVIVFHAGTARTGGQLVSSGGRVLGITAVGPDVAAALKTAYTAATAIDMPGKQYRTDIGTAHDNTKLSNF